MATASEAQSHLQCAAVSTWEQGAVDASAGAEGDVATEVSVVIPCLNEADTIARCVTVARDAMMSAGIAGEVVVADNGSDDGSQGLAREAGARVVDVPQRGYGSALMSGIEASRGRFVVMGDADLSYDFAEIPRFVARWREGYELVQGCRLPRGGGRIMPDAMPRLHRWLGNPMFSTLARRWFRSPVTDIYCGLRGFSRDLYDRLDQRCVGMEFATEMVIKASLYGARIAEVPITLHRDGRIDHPPHLRTFRDGWRTLRFFLLYSPGRLFLAPGLVLMVLGLLGYAIALPGLEIAGVMFDAHTLLFASLALLCGFQTLVFAVFSKTFAVTEGLLPPARWTQRLLRMVTLERGLAIGGVMVIGGLLLLLSAVNQWRAVGFGDLEYAHTMRLVIPGATLTALGVQMLLASFFVSILSLRRR